MRLLKNKNICLTSLVLLSFGSLLSQNNTTTLTLNSQSQPQTVADYIARDKIVVLPNNRLVPGNPTGQTHLYLDKNIIAPIDAGGNPYSGYSVTDVYTIDKNLPTGYVNGNYNISDGQVGYNIPIPIAPGTAGMVPDISISYNSSQIGGLVGSGWGISGISSITRLPKNFFHQFSGEATPISLTSADLFSLDGNIIGSNTGTGNPNIRRLENDNFTEVNYVNPTGTYDYFQVTTKEGLFMEYGSDPDSKLLINNPANNTNIALTYYLKKVTDKNGNYYTYHYYNQNGEVAIQEIKYTGNANAGFLPYNSIKFYYDTRDDKNTTYFKGNELNSTLILREIELFCENNSFKKIIPTYDFINDRSFLSKITEYSADNKQLNPTKFAYDNPAYAFSPGGNLNLGANLSSQFTSSADYTIGDFNGDGVSDVLTYLYSGIDPLLGTKTYTGVDLFINQGNGSNYVQVPGVASALGAFYIPYSMYGATYSSNPDGNMTGDLNGDGKEDLVIIFNSSGGHIGLKPFYSNIVGNTGSFTSPTNSQFFLPFPVQMKLADIDGDKQAELIALGNESGSQYMYIHNFTNNTTQIKATTYTNIIDVVDFEGDGTKELLIEDNNQTKVLKISNYFKNSSTPNFNVNVVGNDNNIQNGLITLYGDFNGDGITDRLFRGGLGCTLRYGTGKQSGSTFYTSPLSMPNVPTVQNILKTVLVSEMDNDGLSDIIILTTDTLNFSIQISVIYGKNLSNVVDLGTDSGVEFPKGVDLFPPPIYFQTDADQIQEFRLGDFDGNNYTDIMIKTKIGGIYRGYRRIYFNKPHNTNDKLTKVTNGHGREVKFSYKPLTDPSVYIKGTGASYPIIDVPSPINIVSSVITQDANDNLYSIDYKYEDLKVHVTGKGFLGFGKISVADNLNQTKTVTDYNLFNQTGQNPCRYPISTKTYLLSSPGLPLYQKDMVYTYEKSFNYPFTFNYYVKTDQITEIDNVKGTNIVTNYTYDNYLNPTIITTNINGGYQINKITNTIDNQNLYGNKYPSYVTSVATEQTRGGSATISIPFKTKYTYDLNNGNLLNQTNNLGKPCENSTDYTYDYAGNISTTIDNSSGNSSRTNTFQRDNYLRFVTKSINPLQYSSQTIYDSRFGKPIKEIDVTGLVKTYTYDGFGRNTSITMPDGKIINNIQKWYDNSDDVSGDPFPVANALITGKTIGTNRPTSWSILNGSGLVLKSNVESINQTVIANQINYTNEGLVSSSKDKYLVPCQNPSNVLTSTNWYDAFKRLIVNEVSDGAVTKSSTLAYSQAAGGYYVINATDPSGKTKRTITDATGLLESVTDNLNGILTYQYYSDGRQKLTVLNSKVVSTTTYDDCGNVFTVDEPNHGITSQIIDGFGQLKSTTNDSKTYNYAYDILGRVQSMIGPEGTYSKQYVLSGNGLGLLEIETGPNGSSNKYYYDNFNRPIKVEKTIAGQMFTNQFEYDQYGNPIKHTYPSGFAVNSSYNIQGFITEIKNNASGNLIWKGDELNEKGIYNKYTLGNSLQTEKTFDNFGFLKTEVAGNIFDHKYDFDVLSGNLNSLEDNIKQLKETFTYDGLDRLKSSTVGDAFGPTQPSLSLTYDLAGNISNKSDVGDYMYLTNKPNAVEFVQNPNNVISQTLQNVAYTNFDKVETIDEGNEHMTIYYGSNQERIKADFSNSLNNTSFSRYYIGDYEKEVNGSVTREIHYINTPSGMLSTYVLENGISNSYFLYNDHLGSPKVITNNNGSIVAEQNFDPWGQRRNVNNWSYTNVTAPPAWLYRGYTGHEHLPQFSLINMNGRMYDPQNARMLSTDPILNDVTNTQAYNKYSYCINNPLKYTDPSGYQIVSGKNNDWNFDYPGSKSSGQNWQDDPTVVKGPNGRPIGGNGKEYSNFGDFGFSIDGGSGGAEDNLSAAYSNWDDYNRYANNELGGQDLFFIDGYDQNGKYSSWYTTNRNIARKYNGPNFKDENSNAAYFFGNVKSIKTKGGNGHNLMFAPIIAPLFFDVSDQKSFPGVKIYETTIMNSKPGYEKGITLVGPSKSAVILVTPGSSLALKQHEYGHYLDMRFGSGNYYSYLPNDINFNLYSGIPSLINAATGIGGSHDSYYTEVMANIYAKIYFGKNISPNFTEENYPTKFK